MFERGFKASKCKNLLKLVISRIALARNKRGAQIRQLRKDVALLLQSGQEPNARKRVDILVKDQNILDAYAVLEKYCEFMLTRLPVMKAEKSCSLDEKEAISSLIFAATRCADLPELLELRSVLEEHYGKQFITKAAEATSGSGVNKTVIEKLSSHTVNKELKLQLMKDITAEYGVDWSPKDLERVSPSDVQFESAQIVDQKPLIGPLDKTTKTIQEKVRDDCNAPACFIRETVSVASHSAEEDQELSSASGTSTPQSSFTEEQRQYVPFVSSAPQSSFAEETRQYIPFISSAPQKLFHAAIFPVEAEISDSEEDAGNNKGHKTSHGSKVEEKDKNELLDQKIYEQERLFTEKQMSNKDGDSSSSSDIPKHANELLFPEECSPRRASQDGMDQRESNSLANDTGVRMDPHRSPRKWIDGSIEATNQYSQYQMVHQLEFQASKSPVPWTETGSSFRVAEEDGNMSLAGADVSTAMYCERDEDLSDRSSSSETIFHEVAAYLEGDDRSYHFTEHNADSLVKQNPEVEKEQDISFAKTSRSDHEYAIQTPVSPLMSSQDDLQGESCIDLSNAVQTNDWLQPKEKHSDENCIKPIVRGSLSNMPEHAHAKLRWRSPNTTGGEGQLRWRSSHRTGEQSSLNNGVLRPYNALGVRCEAEKVDAEDSDASDRRSPLLMLESAKTRKLEALGPSSVRSRRTGGVSVRSRRSPKIAENLRQKTVDLGRNISGNQRCEADGGSSPETKYEEASCREYLADGNKDSCSFSESNFSEAILSEHSSRQPADSPYHRSFEEVRTLVDSGENQMDKALTGPSSSAKTQVDQLPAQPVSLKTSALHLPSSQRVSKARSNTSKGTIDVQTNLIGPPFFKDQIDSSSTLDRSTRLDSFLNLPHPEIIESQARPHNNDDDLMVRFQALKAKLFQ